jgi:hypothetical protein
MHARPRNSIRCKKQFSNTIAHLMLRASTLFSLNSPFSKFQSKLCENRTSFLTHLGISSPKHLLRSKPRVFFSSFGLHIQKLNSKNLFETYMIFQKAIRKKQWFCQNLNIGYMTMCGVQGPWSQESVFGCETHPHKCGGKCKRWSPMTYKCTYVKIPNV